MCVLNNTDLSTLVQPSYNLILKYDFDIMKIWKMISLFESRELYIDSRIQITIYENSELLNAFKE